MSVRIGIISDTHGLLRPEVLENLKDCSVILHAGDVDGPEILDQLSRIGAIYVVRGNNDFGPWARRLGKTLSFCIEGVRFFMVHDRRDAGRACSNADVVVFGHTHHYFQETVDGQLWLNPGSCGYGRFGMPVTMAVMEIDQGDYTVKQILLQNR